MSRIFDIEKAKAGAPVCTRDGKPVRIICWDFKNNIYRGIEILALVRGVSGEDVYLYNNDGKRLQLKGEDNSLDLMMAPVKHEGWVNIYKDEDGRPETGGRIWKDKESAQDVTQGNESYIVTAKIEWVE